MIEFLQILRGMFSVKTPEERFLESAADVFDLERRQKALLSSPRPYY